MLELQGHINDDGTAKIFNRKNLDKWFRGNKGKDFVIKVERKKKKRSDNQNAYYWGVVVKMIQDRLFDLGNEFSLQDVHEVLKAKFNTGEVVNGNGVSDEFVLSTAKLTTTEFMVYLDKIQRWASEFLNIVIPNPNEQTAIDFIVAKNDEDGITIVEQG